MADRIQLGSKRGKSDYEQAGKRRHQITRRLDDGREVEVTSLESTQDINWLMELEDEQGRNLYHTDPSFRATVEDLVANSPALLHEENGLARRNVIPTDAEMLEGLRDDAFKQRVEQLTLAAGGDDLVAKYNAAFMLVHPTEDQYEFLSEAQARTQPEAQRPFEEMLRQRKALGMGPLKGEVQPDEAEAQAYEDQKNAEALAYLEEHGGGEHEN